MATYSQATLLRIEQNDDRMTTLRISDSTFYVDDSTNTVGLFNPRVGSDSSRLGESIGENTHLTRLEFDSLNDDHRGHEITLDVTHTAFFDGLKRNSSIHELALRCYHQSIGGVIYEILKAYQANNNLTLLRIESASLENEGEHVIATTLRRCTNLQELELFGCSNISDEQLLPIVETMRGRASLEILDLEYNRIGNAGCEVLATLLEDPISNLCTLDLTGNEFDNAGTTILANSLANNAKLRKLYLGALPQGVHDVFSGLLCNTSSVNQTYLSNHTLEEVTTPNGTAFAEEVTTQHDMSFTGAHLASLLQLNMGPNKSHVAIKKVLKYHPNIDMEPLFHWNTEGEGERDLKALPYIIEWFEKAGEAVADDEGGEESYNIEGRKLSAIYQFAQAMPLLFVPAVSLSSRIAENGRV